MKPDWDKLGDQYASSESVMIVDVDCTADGGSTCQKHGVQGYPTIKYFLAGSKSGKPYNGGRDFNSMKQFAETTLNKPTCNAVTKKNCLPNEISFIEKNEGKTAEELGAEMKNKTEELKIIKKERQVANAELAEKEKGWKKKEKLLNKATGILKQLEKEAKKAPPKSKAPPKEDL